MQPIDTLWVIFSLKANNIDQIKNTKGNGMQFKHIILAIFIFSVLGGCAHYKTTLINAQGEKVICEASGKSGAISGYHLREGFEACINAAKAQGFKEVSPMNLKPE